MTLREELDLARAALVRGLERCEKRTNQRFFRARLKDLDEKIEQYETEKNIPKAA